MNSGWVLRADPISATLLKHLTTIASRIHHSLTISQMLNTAVQETRLLLHCDRLLIYQFLPDGDGIIAAEAVISSCQTTLNRVGDQPCFADQWSEVYHQRLLQPFEDLSAIGRQPSHKHLFDQWQVQAHLVVPIALLQSPIPQSWGLLIAHHCESTHTWLPVEHQIIQYMALQLSIALRYIDCSLPHGRPIPVDRGLTRQTATQHQSKRTPWRTELCKPMTDLVLAWESNGDGIWDWNVQTNDVLFSHRWKEMLGFADHEISSTLSEWDERIHPEDRTQVYDAIESHLYGKADYYISEHRVQCKDKTYKWVLDRGKIVSYTEDGQPLRFIGTHTDITERKQLEESLRENQITLRQQAERERISHLIAQRIRQSLDLDQILQTTVDEVRHFLQTDRVLIYRLYDNDESGVVMTESVATADRSILQMTMSGTYLAEVKGQIHHDRQVHQISDIYTANLNPEDLKLMEQLQVRAKLIVPILQQEPGQSEQIWGLLIAHHCSDIREWQSFDSELLIQLATQLAIAIQQSELHHQLQLANQQLKNLVLMDDLTQVANRRCFEQEFHQEWQRLIREHHPLSLLIADIDYFKQYNDACGHPAGDRCLQLVAQALQQAMQRTTDRVARYGGEEFVMILPNTDSWGALQVAEKIHTAIRHLHLPHPASPIGSYLTISIGVATLIPSLDLQPLDLINAADQALYQAKTQGRDRSCLYPR